MAADKGFVGARLAASAIIATVVVVSSVHADKHACPSDRNNIKIIWRHPLEPLELARHIVDIVEDRKAEDIRLLDLRPDTVIADFFVLANGTNERQLRALSEYVREEIKEKHGVIPYSKEGTPESGWMILDYGNVVVHLFQAEQREFYDIEGLWSNVAHVLLSIQ